ncbi:unannotated protein [freshwater metagenome]|uniref:Unannotated protein n=1 Tax=freshwater metagenome TaxID=449393 RepID=A0A6J7FWR8_9ZZZZ|nr:glycosyltransferase [Actinomycetota bacterium]
MTDPAVSIVVPVFATEEYFGECLSSLLRQTFRDFEVVVVDDCSPGDPEAVIASVAGSDPRVRLVRQETNQGLLHARMAGGWSARGHYLGFVDSDDTVEDWFIEKLYGAARQHDADLVQCAFTICDPHDRVVNRGGDAHELLGAEVMHGMLAGKMNNSLWNKLMRTSLWRVATRTLKGQPVSFSDDLVCLLHVVTHVNRYAHIPDPGYRYLPRTSSITMAVGTDALVSNLQSLDRSYRSVSQVLTHRDEPAALVRRFFEREFRVVANDILGRLAQSDTDVSSGLPRTPVAVGLLGAMALASIDEQQ